MIYDAYVAEPGPSGNPCRYPHPPPPPPRLYGLEAFGYSSDRAEELAFKGRIKVRSCGSKS